MQTVEGPFFRVAIPEQWGVSEDESMKVLAAPPRARYQANIVWAETRCSAPVRLAAQYSERSLSREVPGAFVVDVQAAVDDTGVERRRIIALAPLELSPLEVHTLVVVQDLLAHGEVIAQLTASVPLAWGWDALDAMTDVLDSASLKPAGDRQTPMNRSEVAGVRDDDPWSSRRAGRPVENLAALHGAQGLVINPVQQLDVSRGALDELLALSGGGRLFEPRVDASSPHIAELLGARLIEADGRPSVRGSALLNYVRRGTVRRLHRTDADGGGATLEAWIVDTTALVVAPVDDRCALAVIEADELARVALSWADLGPAWPAALDPVTVTEREFTRLLAGDGHGLLAPEHPLRRPGWTYFSTTGTSQPLAWVWIADLGAVRVGRQGDRVTLRADDQPALWRTLTASVLDAVTDSEPPRP